MKITKKTKLGGVVGKHPETVEIFLKSGLHCAGCAAASFETIEQGCKAHGMDDNKIDALIKKLNKKIKGDDKDG